MSSGRGRRHDSGRSPKHRRARCGGQARARPTLHRCGRSPRGADWLAASINRNNLPPVAPKGLGIAPRGLDGRMPTVRRIALGIVKPAYNVFWRYKIQISSDWLTKRRMSVSGRQHSLNQSPKNLEKNPLTRDHSMTSQRCGKNARPYSQLRGRRELGWIVADAIMTWHEDHRRRRHTCDELSVVEGAGRHRRPAQPQSLGGGDDAVDDLRVEIERRGIEGFGDRHLCHRPHGAADGSPPRHRPARVSTAWSGCRRSIVNRTLPATLLDEPGSTVRLPMVKRSRSEGSAMSPFSALIARTAACSASRRNETGVVPA